MLSQPTSHSPIPDWQRQRGSFRDTTLVFHVPFEEPYQALGHPSPNPAADWATHAIETLRQNRARFAHRQQKSAAQIREIGPIPHWVDLAVQLQELSAASVDEWRRVIRLMIAEQLPDIHLHPDWKSRVASKSLPVAHRDILDLIIEAVNV